MSKTDTVLGILAALSIFLILFSIAGMGGDAPPAALDDTTVIIPTTGPATDEEKTGAALADWERERATPTEVMPAAVQHGDDSDFHPEAGSLWIPEVAPEDARAVYAMTDVLHVNIIDGEVLPEEVTEFHPLKVVSDELGDWIPEAHTLATPHDFNHVLTERVRWDLLTTFDSLDTPLELTST